mgnify:CR=1 FL=1
MDIPKIDLENFLRKEFEKMHAGRRLTRHSLRGTYQAPQIAALWNQHKKTARLIIDTLANAEKDECLEFLLIQWSEK